MIELTRGEAESLLDFIELNLIQDIRDDVDIDSMEWLANMVSIWAKCKEATKK